MRAIRILLATLLLGIAGQFGLSGLAVAADGKQPLTVFRRPLR